MNELEEIQSRTCFNQRLDIFFSFGSGAAILLEALNRKRQAVGRRASLVIQGRSHLSQEECQKERAARRIPQRAIHQSARSHKSKLAPKRHTWRKRQSHRLSQRLTLPPSLPSLSIVSCLLSLLSFFLSFFSLPGLFLLIWTLLFGFCCIASRLVIVAMGRFALLSLALASIFTGGLAAVSLSPACFNPSYTIIVLNMKSLYIGDSRRRSCCPRAISRCFRASIVPFIGDLWHQACQWPGYTSFASFHQRRGSSHHRQLCWRKPCDFG